MNTPVTDLAVWKSLDIDDEFVRADLARQLERDRARLLEALRLCQASLQKLTFVDDEIMKSRNSAYRALASLEIKD